MKELYFHSFESKIGPIFLAETGRGLARIQFGKISEKKFKSSLKRDYPDHTIASGGKENLKAEKQLKGYLNGKVKKFNLRLDIPGTGFQKTVLRKVKGIPYGKVKTYGEIAKSIGNPKASRAVGSANAKNRLPIVIPCHRVVGVSGPGGYAGGLKLKKKLLEIEGYDLSL
jgi:O-6-methylguanine DNA methyltransferase